MGKIYNNPMGRLNEARNHYKGLINEAPGFPGMCCDGGPTCVPVTFASANDDCDSLGMDDCGHSDCMGDPEGPTDGGPLGLDDLQLTDIDKPVEVKMKSCAKCNNGYAVMQQIPMTDSCSTLGQGWVEYTQGLDPCESVGTSDPCAFPDISGPCATQANLISQFVSGDPSQFLSNMLSWYTNPPNPMNYPYHRGCNFLEIVRQKHLDHLSTGIAINSNHPNGTQMGPLWIAQKTSKVAYLDCVLSALNADNCCGSPNGGGQNDDGVAMASVKPVPSGDVKDGKRGAERKGMRK